VCCILLANHGIRTRASGVASQRSYRNSALSRVASAINLCDWLMEHSWLIIAQWSSRNPVGHSAHKTQYQGDNVARIELLSEILMRPCFSKNCMPSCQYCFHCRAIEKFRALLETAFSLVRNGCCRSFAKLSHCGKSHVTTRPSVPPCRGSSIRTNLLQVCCNHNYLYKQQTRTHVAAPIIRS
jgi:hypothetical protein